MKKVAFGCLGVFVLLVIGGAVGSYFWIYRPAKAYLTNVAQLREIPKIEATITNAGVFQPPASNELTADRVQRFIRAQRTLQTRLGQRVEPLAAKYRALNRTGNAQAAEPSIAEAFGAVKDIATVLVEAKRAQAEALNQQGFSLAEYDWTRARMYEAAGIPVDVAIAKAIRDAAAGRVPDYKPGMMESTSLVPEVNRQLVAPHIRELTDGAMFVFFGL